MLTFIIHLLVLANIVEKLPRVGSVSKKRQFPSQREPSKQPYYVAWLSSSRTYKELLQNNARYELVSIHVFERHYVDGGCWIGDWLCEHTIRGRLVPPSLLVLPGTGLSASRLRFRAVTMALPRFWIVDSHSPVADPAAAIVAASATQSIA